MTKQEISEKGKSLTLDIQNYINENKDKETIELIHLVINYTETQLKDLSIEDRLEFSLHTIAILSLALITMEAGINLKEMNKEEIAMYGMMLHFQLKEIRGRCLGNNLSILQSFETIQKFIMESYNFANFSKDNLIKILQATLIVISTSGKL